MEVGLTHSNNKLAEIEAGLTFNNNKRGEMVVGQLLAITSCENGGRTNP